MAMNRRFRRPFTRRAKPNYKWHREYVLFTNITSNTTQTTNLLIPDDWSSATQLSPSSVTLYAVKWSVSYIVSSLAAGRTSYTCGIEILDQDSAPSSVGTADDILDERWLMFGAGQFFTPGTTGPSVPHVLHEGSTRCKANLRDQTVNWSTFNAVSSVAGVSAHGIVSLLIAGDTN